MAKRLVTGWVLKATGLILLAAGLIVAMSGTYLVGVPIAAAGLGLILPRVFSTDIWEMAEHHLGNSDSREVLIYAAMLVAGVAGVLLGQQLDGGLKFLVLLVGALVGIFGFASLYRRSFRLLVTRAEAFSAQLAPKTRMIFLTSAGLIVLLGVGWVIYANLNWTDIQSNSGAAFWSLVVAIYFIAAPAKKAVQPLSLIHI